jgi:glutamyl-tRNA synthetase
VRTALFNWLFARHHSGKFVLRIEDTDRSRSTDEYIEQILEGMRWLGLDWDEGPFRQTERQSIYRQYAEKLIEEGKTYFCYCTPEELGERRKEAMKQGRPPRYDRRCRDRKEPRPGIKPAVRFKAPLTGTTIFHDLLRGEVKVENEQLDDLIIMRSDGTPTYNFTVVVDDATMNITHVIRGDDHVANTPRQVLLYQGLGFELPLFAHLSIILGPNKAKLSKRHGAASILEYRDRGYLPEALVNYLVRLGWSHGDQEVFTLQEMIEHFSLDNVSPTAAVYDTDKLLWMNSHYLRSIAPAEIARRLEPFLDELGVGEAFQKLSGETKVRIVESLQPRTNTLVEMARGAVFYMAEDLTYDEKAGKKFLTAQALPLLEDITEALSQQQDYGEEALQKLFANFAEEKNVKLGKVAMPVRVALSGSNVSPGLFEIISILGKEKVLARLQHGIDYIKSRLR